MSQSPVNEVGASAISSTPVIAFAKTFPLFGQQAAAQLQNADNYNIEIMQALPAQIALY